MTLQIVASLIDTAKGIIYDHHMFIVQATDLHSTVTRMRVLAWWACTSEFSSCLAPALGVTKFTNVRDKILVTVVLSKSTNSPQVLWH